MRFRSRAFLAGGLGFAAAFAVACGSSNGLLSANQSSTLAGDLNSISSAISAGRCSDAQRAADHLNNAVAGLPQTVTSTLLQNLAQGAGTVVQLSARDCHQRSSASSSTSSSTSTSSTSSVPTTTTTTTTTITPTTTTSTSSTATNGSSSGTSTTSNGGVGIGGTGTAGP